MGRRRGSARSERSRVVRTRLAVELSRLVVRPRGRCRGRARARSASDVRTARRRGGCSANVRDRMIPVVTASEMRALDKATIEDIGIPADALMETAGRAVAAAARTMTDGKIAVVCGPGNNGGAGFVTARVLCAAGREATVYLAVPRAKVP